MANGTEIGEIDDKRIRDENTENICGKEIGEGSAKPPAGESTKSFRENMEDSEEDRGECDVLVPGVIP